MVNRGNATVVNGLLALWRVLLGKVWPIFFISFIEMILNFYEMKPENDEFYLKKKAYFKHSLIILVHVLNNTNYAGGKEMRSFPRCLN